MLNYEDKTMNIKRLYEIWEECYSEYGSMWPDYLPEHTLEMDILYWNKTMRLSSEETYDKVLPSLLAAQDSMRSWKTLLTRRLSLNKAIGPKELVAFKATQIPDFVFDVVNELLAEKWNGSTAIIKQKDIVSRICRETGEVPSSVFDKGWLNFEDIYRAKGWRVGYDKPSYNESYDAFFKFSVR